MTSGLTRLEIASGAVWGPRVFDLLPDPKDQASPIIALERALRLALLRPPCLLSFSGGKDSSFLLAVATDVARRDGLPLPVPVTWRFSQAPRAEESQWQDAIIRALRITDWQVMTAGDDLDIVAPLAQGLLREHGIRYPANLHLHQPIIEAAAGGSVITGLGGDQVLTCWHHPPKARRGSAAWLRKLAPATVRAAGRLRQAHAERPWLRPPVARSVHTACRKDSLSEPSAPIERLAWRSSRRHLHLAKDSCDQLGRAYDVEIHHPLLDTAFHGALAVAVPRDASLTRSDLIALIGGARVPPVVYRRRTKAWFGEVFVGEPSRVFAAGWDGSGVDEELVDTKVLRRLWSSAPPPNGTAMLIQQLWLQQDRAADRAAT